ncbi:hypothetical protein [Nitrosomonas ureae]|uniref:Uncharacterized protein n=1 Tax=Nitrosomonas ureae TaxID=44577 RepID=A0A1H9D0H5_9PROT|nr:hypothetical protein [Nitrosomonas ureae]SEQ07002.1 hypothetical protein SAMN05421510_101828 [Nitrosomonas ureae]
MSTYCIPQVVGIPGRESTKLDWWTSSTTPLVNYPEDPNWLGCFRLGESGGTSAHVDFRALSGQDGSNRYLYLSWKVLVQPNPPVINQDGLNLLIGDGTNHIAVKVRLATIAPTINGGQAIAYAIETYNYTVTGGLSAPHSPSAAWATDTGRTWIDYSSPISTLVPPQVIPWAIQLRIPLGVNLAPAGSPVVTLPINASFKLWWQLNVTVNGNMVPYPWPGTAFTTSQINIIPNGLTPHEVALPGVPGCATGITLARSQIGIQDVANGVARNEIKLDLTNNPPDVSLPNHQNSFYARPDVSSLSATQISSLRADFRLANWGTQFTVPTPNSWKIVPGGEDVHYQNPIAPFSNAEFRFTWPKPPLNSFTIDFINGVKLFISTGGTAGQDPHQCMLVEMKSDDGSVIFTKSSEFHNLRAVNASIVREMAEVSVIGNPPIGSGPRDVYLYLQTMGMPQVVDAGYRERMADWLRGSLTSVVEATTGNGGTTMIEDIFDYAPTYQVHAYYDTGMRMQLEDGSSIKILRPQTSFGYVVSHKGSLVGWESRLYGAEKLTDNFYVVRVPNNSSVKVETAIQARESADEKPLPDDGLKGCKALVAKLETQGFLGKLVAFLVRPLCNLFGDKWWILILGFLVVIALLLL